MSLVVDGRVLAVPSHEKGFSFDKQAAANALNVDRRTCKREVPMKVLVFGLSRTGTTSIRHALLQLGYFDVYHGVSPWNENPPDARLWLEAFKGKYEGGRKFEREDWDCLLGHCMVSAEESRFLHPSYAQSAKAVTGTPCSLFAEELIAAYPEARVILTIRDSSASWRQSMESTIVPMTRQIQLLSLLKRIASLFRPPDVLQEYGNLTAKYTRVLDVPWDFQRIYDDYNAWILRLVPDRDGIMVYNAKDGWEPLCKFLGVGVPDKSFPKNNDGGAYMKRFKSSQENHELRRARIIAKISITVLLVIVMALTVGRSMWS